MQKQNQWNVSSVKCPSHRCRNRQIFGGAKDFCPNFRSFQATLCANVSSHTDHKHLLLGWFPKIQKVSCESAHIGRQFFNTKQRWAPIFRSQTTLGAIFAQIFWYFANKFRFIDFGQIFRDFWQITTFRGAIVPSLSTPLTRMMMLSKAQTISGLIFNLTPWTLPNVRNCAVPTGERCAVHSRALATFHYKSRSTLTSSVLFDIFRTGPSTSHQ